MSSIMMAELSATEGAKITVLVKKAVSWSMSSPRGSDYITEW